MSDGVQHSSGSSSHGILALQLMCGFATLAAIARVTEQHPILPTFVVLPFVLFLALVSFVIPSRFVVGRSLAVGGITGAIVGLLSTLTSNDLTASQNVSTLAQFCTFIFPFELFHLPVIVGSIGRSFLLVSWDLRSTLVVCGCLLGIIPCLFIETYLTGYYVILSFAAACLVVLVVFWLVNPTLLPHWRSLLLWTVFFITNIMWQISYLDAVQWDWHHSYFPLPGSILGFVLLFLMPGEDLTVCTWERSKWFLNISWSFHSVSLRVISHAGTYIAVRIVLTQIINSRTLPNVYLENSPCGDAWICSVGMVAFVSLFHIPVFQKLSWLFRLLVVTGGLLLYMCYAVSRGLLCNGYFLDEILGLTLLIIISSDLEVKAPMVQ